MWKMCLWGVVLMKNSKTINNNCNKYSQKPTSRKALIINITHVYLTL